MKPVQPIDSQRGRLDRWPRGNEGPVDHYNGKTEGTGGLDLRDCGASPGILGENDFNTVIPEQSHVAFACEGSRCPNDRHSRQSERLFGRVDKTDDISVLWSLSEFAKRKPADAAKYRAGRIAKGGDGSGGIGHLRPIILRGWPPGWPLDREKRRAGGLRRFDRVPAHLARKWMGGVENGVDAVFFEEARETGASAKSPASCWHGLRTRVGGSSGQG